MPSIGSIKIRIGGDIKGLEKSLRRAEFRLQRSGRKLAELGSRLSSAITLPIIGIGAASLKAAGDLQGLKLGMESMMGSTEAAKKEIDLLRKEALKPGLNFEQALKGSARLQAIGIDAELARRALGAMGNALALVGGTGEQLDGVTLALSQIASKGKIQAEEINQIAERVPQIRKILQDSFGTADTKELQKLGIGFEEFITKIIVEAEKLPQAQSGIKNSIENTKVALQEAAAIIGEKLFPVFEAVSKVVLKVVNAFSRLPDGVQENIIKFSLLAAATGPLLYAYGTLKIAMGGLAGTLSTLVGSFGRLFFAQSKGIAIGKVFSGVMMAAINPLGTLFGTISRLLIPLNLATGGFKKLGASIAFAAKNPVQTLKAAFISLAGLISGITIPFGLVAAAVAAFGVAVVVNIGPARKNFVELANTFIDLYNESIAFRGIVETISTALKTLYTVGKAAISFLITGFKSLGKAVVALFKGDVDGIRDALLGGWEEVKKTGIQAGKDIAKALSEGYKNTFDQKEKLDFITEKDVDRWINTAAKAAQDVSDTLFGTNKADTSDVPKTVLPTNFDRDPKSKKSTDKHVFDRLNSREAPSLSPTNLISLEGFEEHTEKIANFYKNIKDAAAETAASINESFSSIIESGIEDGLVSLGSTLGDIIAGTANGTNLLGSVLSSIAAIMIKLGKLAIGAGVTIKGIKESLKSLNPVVAIAGGVALVALGSIIKSKAAKLATPPKLARGGLAFGETQAIVGDNPNARIDPEVIAPLSKLKQYLQPSGGGTTVMIPNVVLRGSDLVLSFERETNKQTRFGTR